MKQLPIFKNSLTTGLLWGILGGIGMLITMKFMRSGLLGILPCVAFLIVSVLTINLKETENKKFKLFMTGLWTFIVISLVVFVYHYFVTNEILHSISFLGFLRRFAAMVGIGILSSGLLTFLVTRKL